MFLVSVVSLKFFQKHKHGLGGSLPKRRVFMKVFGKSSSYRNSQLKFCMFFCLILTNVQSNCKNTINEQFKKTVCIL